MFLDITMFFIYVRPEGVCHAKRTTMTVMTDEEGVVLIREC